MPLTDTRIRNARATTKPYKLTDSGGLYIEVRPSGKRLWRFRYRIAGKENLFALGEFVKAAHEETKEGRERRIKAGLLTLTEARSERDMARGLVRQGIHPAQQRNLERLQRTYEGANTFEAVAREWLNQNVNHWTPRTKRQRERLLEREVFPRIGQLPIKHITPAHILPILKRLEKDAPSFAVLAQQAISATFRLAIATLRADADPIPALRDSIKVPPTKNKTPLTEKQIPEFFRKLDAYSGSFQTKAAIRLLWWTLARTNEALAAKWVEFDFDRAEWRISGERMKRRTVTDHVVPLPAQAVAMLKTLNEITGGSEYVFPSRSSPRKPASVGILWKAIAEGMGYNGEFCPHAIRTTGSTMLNEMGFNGDWIERQLAHHDGNETRASYNGAKYLEHRRDMMKQWANQLDALCRGAAVTPIKRATR